MTRRAKRLLVIAALLAEPIAMWARGYPLGGNLVVRCHRGHLFTTLWIPSISFKALRLGWWRVQYCPVGGHWALVTPVREGELTAGETAQARSRHDLRVP
jgi:hypothetical protein